MDKTHHSSCKSAMKTMEDVSGMLHFKTVSYGGLEQQDTNAPPITILIMKNV